MEMLSTPDTHPGFEPDETARPPPQSLWRAVLKHGGSAKGWELANPIDEGADALPRTGPRRMTPLLALGGGFFYFTAHGEPIHCRSDSGSTGTYCV